MLDCKNFYDCLVEQGISFFTGVPDSLLKDFCNYLLANVSIKKHIIAVNEGGAVGLAAGYYLATGKPSLVYMQNSGLGNATNPLLSLADPEVFGIPMILLIGWRGEPGIKDEPQHIKQGKVTLPICETMKIPYKVLSGNDSDFQQIVSEMVGIAVSGSCPVALIVKQGVFKTYQIPTKDNTSYLTREKVIEQIVSSLPDNAAIVASIGHISRELYEFRERSKEGHQKDFLTVGSMGHASQIAMGVAINKQGCMVVCLDGDGATLMHLGSLAIIGQSNLKNFKHIVLNNGAHDSVGGQPTVGFQIDIPSIAKACGYEFSGSADTIDGISKIMPVFLTAEGKALLEIKVALGVRNELTRPKLTPSENKKTFMNYLNCITNNRSSQIIHYGEEGALNFFKRFIAFCEEGSSVFVVAGKRSFSSSGAEIFFKNVFPNISATFFQDFSTNPKIEDVQKGVKLFKSHPHNLIVAIGGGSAIDIGKLINFFVSNNIDPKEHLRNKNIPKKSCFLMMAVPTTAGAGSESTQFAVVYDGMVKHSIDNCTILPSHVLLNPKFTESQSKYLSACSGMDALAHGIESYWAVGATNKSLEYSEKSIRLCLQHLEKVVNEPDIVHREGMVNASYVAGKAINITRTTAAHALSYAMTSHYELPHGHAVALVLPIIMRMNAEIVLSNVNSSIDLCTIQQRMKKLYSFFGNNYSAEDAAKFLEELLDRIGISRKWFYERNLDIVQVRNIILQEINIERLQNNPRNIDNSQLAELIKQIN